MEDVKGWEIVDETDAGEAEVVTERLKIAGGWLYKVEETILGELSQCHVVFVPYSRKGND